MRYGASSKATNKEPIEEVIAVDETHLLIYETDGFRFYTSDYGFCLYRFHATENINDIFLTILSYYSYLFKYL